jgi:hypothetical protein
MSRGDLADEVVAFARSLCAYNGDVVRLMRAEERERGYLVVEPGSVAWLPFEDWRSTCVVSIRELKVVRLVILEAVNPGHGALRRLLAQLVMIGLGVEVVEPVGRVADFLKRSGWTRHERGSTFRDREEFWTP